MNVRSKSEWLPAGTLKILRSSEKRGGEEFIEQLWGTKLKMLGISCVFKKQTKCQHPELVALKVGDIHSRQPSTDGAHWERNLILGRWWSRKAVLMKHCEVTYRPATLGVQAAERTAMSVLWISTIQLPPPNEVLSTNWPCWLLFVRTKSYLELSLEKSPYRHQLHYAIWCLSWAVQFDHLWRHLEVSLMFRYCAEFPIML